MVSAALLDEDDPTTPTAGPVPKTVRETVTLQGKTLTVTTEAEPPATTAPTTTEAPPEQPQGSPAELNDQGYALMRQGNYQGALPLLERAYQGLAGTGQLAEAYTAYNLAYTRLALGSCNGVLELLDRSEQVQGKRKEISRLRKEAERGCGR